MGTAVFSAAQSHISVPVDDSIYYILEQAQLRGICGPLPSVKPYSRNQVLDAIDEILAWDESLLVLPSKAFLKLSDREREILEAARKRYTVNGPEGFNLARGAYHFDLSTKKDGYRIAGNAGVGVESVNSMAAGDTKAFGTDTWFSFFLNGDLGENFSYDFNFRCGIMLAERSMPGEGWAFYTDDPATGSVPPGITPEPYNIQHEVNAYQQPKAFFPYTYRRQWDGFIFAFGEEVSAGNMINWPNVLSSGTAIISELSGAAFDGVLSYRFGRIRREWAGATGGGSLVFNGYARPFVAFEATYHPASWFSFSSLTGGLEYYNEKGISESAWTFQNLFSIEQVEFNYKNFVHFDIGSTVVYPKRFELGYIFPINNNFMYQNNIGDFDNMSLFFDLAFQYPGLGGIWFSAYADEVEASSIMKAFTLDRNMFALQAGAKIIIPHLPFTTIIMSYTKIEPYCYTHTRNFFPWYNSDQNFSGGGDNKPMETSYTNNGVGIGYYLPPNSDEFKIRLETRPFVNTVLSFQYQLIRHGAEYGSGQVDGSSYQSELWSSGRGSITKDFLNDGAYEWINVFKLGAGYSFTKIPLSVYAETGVVTTRWEDRRSGHTTDEYNDAFSFIFTLGMKYSIR
jgi:hypothetical protein